MTSRPAPTPDPDSALARARELDPEGRAALVGGRLSGIQAFLRAAAARGSDGAGRRLRFRSFLILAEAAIAARRLCVACGCRPEEALLEEAGGHFLLALPAAAAAALPEVERATQARLLEDAGAAVAFSLEAVPLGADDSPETALERLGERLRAARNRPLRSLLIPNGKWDPSRFRLENPAGESCPHCGVARSSSPDRPCRFCRAEQAEGGALGAAARWCVGPIGAGDDPWTHRLLQGQEDPPRDTWEGTPLPRSVPEGDFDALAASAPGRDLLAYVKVDGDRVGRLFRGLSLVERAGLSRQIDGFFREWLDARPDRGSVYLVYGGGDDAFFVTAWHRAPALAAEMQDAWSRSSWGSRSTLSAGISFQPPRFPLAHALASVDDALESAKSTGRNALFMLGTRLTWPQVTEVVRLEQGFRDSLEQEDLPTAALRTLLDHLPAPVAGPRESAPVDPLREFLRGRAKLCYSLARNSPRGQYSRFWTLVAPLLPDDGRADGDLRNALQALPAAVTLALWATRGKEGSDDR